MIQKDFNHKLWGFFCIQAHILNILKGKEYFLFIFFKNKVEGLKCLVRNALESNTAFTVWLFPFGELGIMNPKQKVAAGFLVFRRLGKEIQYLLLQTSYGENHWSPPKG